MASSLPRILRLATARTFFAVFLTASMACTAPPIADEGVPAKRVDVIVALYRQLEFVLEERAQLGAADPALEPERRRLSRLADEIALRIVRIDPDVNLERLQQLLTNERATG